MEMHPRTMIVQSATGEFGVAWAKSNVKTYEDGYLILNTLDRFWIEASRNDIPVSEAVSQWDFNDLCLGIEGQEVGNKLARIVSDNSLTYAEIGLVLTKARSLDLKYHIRQERHPDNPDRPGDAA